MFVLLHNKLFVEDLNAVVTCEGFEILLHLEIGRLQPIHTSVVDSRVSVDLLENGEPSCRSHWEYFVSAKGCP